MKTEDYIKNIAQAERRFFAHPIEFRADEAENRNVSGYGAVFNKDADFGWVIERIMPGAFDEVLQDDVRALFNHDPSLILARTHEANTLTLSVDETGLRYSFKAPNTSVGNDLLENLRLKNISQSSFAFVVRTDKWTDQGRGKPYLREIVKMRSLIDVSPVTYPAYKDTTVANRSFTDFTGIKNPLERDLNSLTYHEAITRLYKHF